MFERGVPGVVVAEEVAEAGSTSGLMRMDLRARLVVGVEGMVSGVLDMMAVLGERR